MTADIRDLLKQIQEAFDQEAESLRAQLAQERANREGQLRAIATELLGREAGREESTYGRVRLSLGSLRVSYEGLRRDLERLQAELRESQALVAFKTRELEQARAELKTRPCAEDRREQALQAFRQEREQEEQREEARKRYFALCEKREGLRREVEALTAQITELESAKASGT